MKEMTSTHDDIEKRLAVFLGLGAFILSALEGMVRGYSLEAMLLQGVIVLTLTTVCAWIFGAWLRAALRSSSPGEELPANVERRSSNQYSLADGAVVVPEHLAEPVISEEVHQPLTGTVVNYTLPELNPAEVEALNAIAAAGPQAEPEAEAKAPAGRK